jgi:hypothetical protein
MAKVKKNKKADAPDGFPQKMWDKLTTTWRDAALTKTTEELETDVVKTVRTMSQTSFDMRNDAKLEALQNEIKDIKGSYTDVLAMEKAKLEFCVYLFNTRGMPSVSGGSDD